MRRGDKAEVKLSEDQAFGAYDSKKKTVVPTKDATDAVLTGCAAAVADSGTLVLDGGPAQGRRAATLLPDLHVCVVRAEQVRSALPGALARLDPARPLTFVSGPSATADIEMIRVKGVHGPRRLAVVLLG